MPDDGLILSERSDLRMRRRSSQIILREVVARNQPRYRGLMGTPSGGSPALSTLTTRVLALAKVDGPRLNRQPSPVRLLLATIGSLVVSLGADAILVVVANAVFPSTKNYVHFRFSDYAKLTAIGVVIACLAWPVVTWLCAAPRWLFLRLAVLVTLVLWLPDVWILIQGQPIRAVFFLMVMHLAIAVVTYNMLVRLAPPHRRRRRAAAASQ